MRLNASCILLCLMLSPTILLAEDFNIEEEDLAPLPKAIETAIRNDKSFTDYQQCKLVGKVIDITGQSGSGFVATTEDGCG